MDFRKEKDFLGEKQIPKDALYGIHAKRASENFGTDNQFHIEWYKAMGDVKKAMYITYKEFKDAATKKYSENDLPIKFIPDETITALISASNEVSEGEHFDNFIVPSISGGAGTSINMNINEIIANLSLRKLGHDLGNYELVHPLEHANIYQSTNDTVPTALKLAVIRLLTDLEDSINKLRTETERLEQENLNNLRSAYTQMQKAVPSSYGRLFSTYSQAFSRDWWRVSKCFERIKVVNLGGSAVGSGLTVPRFIVMNVVNKLREITNHPITKSENMHDATANLDTFVEVHAIMKSHAVNLEKMVSDLRLLASDISNNHEITLPKRQAGSSIMPSKVNPVIPEFVISCAHKVYANDMLVSSMCGQGCLDLNAYVPIIGHAVIESLKLLLKADESVKEFMLKELSVNKTQAYENMIKSPVATTALVPFIGYDKATELAQYMKNNEIDIFKANEMLKVIENERLITILKSENLLKSGFSLNDLKGE